MGDDMPTSLRDQEIDALAAVAAARRIRNGSSSEERRTQADLELSQATDTLKLVRTAISNAQPHRGRYIKCCACRNVFVDEGSYLMHWNNQFGHPRCVFTLSILKAMGFLVNKHSDSRESPVEYVLRHPSQSA